MTLEEMINAGRPLTSLCLCHKWPCSCLCHNHRLKARWNRFRRAELERGLHEPGVWER
jgi:hypothetical protein